MANNQNKKNDYVSPLSDELQLTLQNIGEGVQLYHDQDNGRLLLDIDLRTRRGITSSGKSIKIATATHMIQGKKKMSLNIFDKDMSDKEIDQLDKFLDRKAKRQAAERKRKDLE